MDKRIISENLRRLKKYKGYSQEKLAGKAGISLSTYRNIENSRSFPRIDTLMAIAQALDVDLKQIVAPVKRLSAVRFRAKKKMKSRQQILADVGRWLFDFNQLEDIVDDRIESKLTDYNKGNNHEIIDVAERFRKRLDLKPDEPINDICGLLESAGIKVYPINLDNNNFFGLSIAPADGGPAVVVNTYERIPVERWIFSAAHELAHLLIHQESFNVEVTSEDEKQEREADMFAAHFLMPQVAFEKKWEESSGLHPLDRILKVKRYFKVSYKTVLYRLTEMKKGNKYLYKWFYSAYKQRTGKSLGYHEEPSSQLPAAFSTAISESKTAKEPENLLKVDFSESRLNKLVRRGIEGGNISLSRGAEILSLSLEEMRELANSWVSYA